MALPRRAVVSAFVVLVLPLAGLACFPSLDFPSDAPADSGAADGTTAAGERDGSAPSGQSGAPDGGTTPVAPDAADGGDTGTGVLDAAFPRTAVLDDFNRADAAELGNGWDFYQVGIANGGAVFKPSASDPSGGIARWAQGFGANQEVFATIKRFATASGGDLGLWAKYSNVSSQGDCQSWDYYVYLNLSIGGAGVYVETCKPTDAGGARERFDISVPWADGDQAGLRVRSDNHAEVYRNGVRVADVSLGTWPYANAGGRIGLGFARAGDALVDDFGGGTAPPP